MTAASRITVAACLCSLGAAAIHAAVAGPHFEASATLGVLFAGAALGQALWAGLFLTRPSARLLVVGVMGNLAILAGWFVSRTAGLPIGPDAWSPEPLAALDLTAATLELVVVGACLVLARSGSYLAPRGVGRFAAVGAAVVAGAVGAAFLAGPSVADHHSPAGHEGHGHVH